MVVGLGNPGSRFEGTPHNVGYDAIDTLAGRLDCKFRRSFLFKSRLGKSVVLGQTVLLVKPETYMNSSGVAVGRILRYYREELQNLIVVLDDADLDPGRLRIKPGGGSGGHRGLASIIEHVHSEAFTRVRIGIGRSKADANLIGHVLKPFPAADRAAAEWAVRRAAEATLCIMEQGIEGAMNAFNGPDKGFKGE